MVEIRTPRTSAITKIRNAIRVLRFESEVSLNWHLEMTTYSIRWRDLTTDSMALIIVSDPELSLVGLDLSEAFYASVIKFQEPAQPRCDSTTRDSRGIGYSCSFAQGHDGHHHNERHGHSWRHLKAGEDIKQGEIVVRNLTGDITPARPKPRVSVPLPEPGWEITQHEEGPVVGWRCLEPRHRGEVNYLLENMCRIGGCRIGRPRAPDDETWRIILDAALIDSPGMDLTELAKATDPNPILRNVSKPGQPTKFEVVDRRDAAWDDYVNGDPVGDIEEMVNRIKSGEIKITSDFRSPFYVYPKKNLKSRHLNSDFASGAGFIGADFARAIIDEVKRTPEDPCCPTFEASKHSYHDTFCKHWFDPATSIQVTDAETGEQVVVSPYVHTNAAGFTCDEPLQLFGYACPGCGTTRIKFCGKCGVCAVCGWDPRSIKETGHRIASGSILNQLCIDFLKVDQS